MKTSNDRKQPLGIYIHIPFCVKKCNYCDFLSFPLSDNGAVPGELQTDMVSEYCNAMCNELCSYSYCAGAYQVKTIYFGGGTPSILDGQSIEKVLTQIRSVFDVDSDAEITLECNPGTTEWHHFQDYRSMGINRLSIGLQSSHNEMLKKLGRIHTVEQFEQQYHEARLAGFDNISIDLMSALPGQTLAQYQKDLRYVVALEPEHISSYGLIIEEGTMFANSPSILKELPEEDLAVAMYEETERALTRAGYHRYEISNYSKKGKESRHNSSYWNGISYLGIGVGASSYLGEQSLRFCNVSDLKQYLLWFQQRVEPDILRSLRREEEWLSPEDEMEEFMFLGLRQMRGVCLQKFQSKFGVSMESVYGDVLQKHISRDNLYMYDNQGETMLALTRAAIPISNQIFVDFMF